MTDHDKGDAMTITADELNALADRVEQEEPSRELDAAVLVACGHQAVNRGQRMDWEYRQNGVGIWRSMPSPTISLDAAVTLTDWCIAHLSEMGGDGLPMCALTDGMREATGYCLNSPTSGVTALARALCAAALRARAAIRAAEGKEAGL